MSETTRRDAAALAALAVLCVVAWGGTLGHYFWEDDFVVMQLGKNLSPSALFAVSPNFRPLDRLSFFVTYRLFGVDPLGYNAVNMALHLINSFLVYLLGRSLFDSKVTGFAAAAMFLTTSTHSDAVFWISARPGLLSLLFLLSALNFWVMFRRTARPAPWYYLALLSLALGLLSKEEAVAYPLILIMTDRLFLRGAGEGRLKAGWYAGVLAPLAIYAVLQIYLQSSAATQSVNISQAKYFLGLHAPINMLEIFIYFFLPAFVIAKIPAQAMPLVLTGLCVVAGLIAAGYAAGYKRQILWAEGWIILAFMPMCFFYWDLLGGVESSALRRYFYAPSVAAAFVFAFFLTWLYNLCRTKDEATTTFVLVMVIALGWNMYRLDEREGLWRWRTGLSRAEVRAVKQLYPSLPCAGAGIYIDGFTQRPAFTQAMLRLVYDDDGLVFYDDMDSLVRSSDVKGKVAFFEKDGEITSYP